jgi:hypothetical protein
MGGCHGLERCSSPERNFLRMNRGSPLSTKLTNTQRDVRDKITRSGRMMESSAFGPGSVHNRILRYKTSLRDV